MMAKIHAPTIEGFEPVRAFRLLDISYLMMRGPAGVRLCLSEPGTVAAGEDPETAGLLARMGAFIGEHDGYRSPDDVKAVEPGTLPAVANPSRGLDGYRVALATVYRHDSAPGSIVKAYDLDRKSAGFQFYLGAWLHDRLAAAGDGLRSPRQDAMFIASGGHRTTVMEHIPGEGMRKLVWDMDQDTDDRQPVNDMITAVRSAIRARLRAAAGWRGLLIANDLRNLHNTIVTDEEPLTPENAAEHAFAIIDQPVIKAASFPLPLLARMVPVTAAERLRNGHGQPA